MACPSSPASVFFGRRHNAIFLSCFAIALSSGCGKKSESYDSITSDKVGAVPGQFTMRPSASWRAQIDSLQAKMDGIFPGLSAGLTRRFADDESTMMLGSEESLTDESKLSDLVKISLPSTQNETVNRTLFGQLRDAKDDSSQPYFETVDTEKYSGKKYVDGDELLYKPPGQGDGDDNADYYNKQYYLDMIRWQDAVQLPFFDERLAEAAPVVVAVLDTGVESGHEDLSGVMWSGDGGVVGYDAAASSPRAVTSATDPDGHGTHVAGIIGAQGKNSLGVHGVAGIKGRGGDPTKSIAEIMAVTVLNANGAGTSEMIARGLKWSVDQHRKQKLTRPNQKMIINMSLGGPFDVDGYRYDTNPDGTPKLEDDLFNNAVKDGDVLIVVAAGNESCTIGGACDVSGNSFKQTWYYPCSYANVVCVAATTQDDKLAGFSNRRASVAITAPGWQILSASNDPSRNKYAVYSGTSQATPVTAGAAAVLWSLYPDFSADEIKQILVRSAAQVESITTTTIAKAGRLDMVAALNWANDLKLAGKKPSEQDPQGVSTTPVVVASEKVPGSTSDPYARSKDAVGGSSGGGGGGGGGSQCGVVAGKGDQSGSLLLLLLMAVLPWTLGRLVRHFQAG
jgi:subtilisin family serine protease